MPSLRRLLIAGVLTFLAGLVFIFPARVAYDWFAPDGVSVSGIRGSIWSGSAKHAGAAGIYIADLEWHFRPLRLFAGELSYVVAAKPMSGFVDVVVGIGFGGDIQLTELQGAVGLQALERVMQIPGLQGNASARFERITVSGGSPIAAKGTVDVSQLLVPAVARSSIGGYRAEFFTQQDGVVVSVEDTDGVIDIAGSMSFPTARSYQFLAKVAAKPNTPQQVRQSLQFLGSANERGQHDLRLEGQF